MKRLVLFAVLLFAQPLNAEDVVVPFENLNVYDELPDYVYSMPRKTYEAWAKLQNAGAYRQAERLADAHRERNPARETFIQTYDYRALVNQSQRESVSSCNAGFNGAQDTFYSGRNVQMSYQLEPWGGGPVHILNPYCNRPAKVITDAEGVKHLVDPDH